MSEASRIQAIQQARQRRVSSAAGKAAVRFEWFINQLQHGIDVTMEKRMRLATEYLRSRVVKNISRPVTKTPTTRIATRVVGGTEYKAGTQYTKVTDRSKKGEYPRADTVQLLKTIMTDVFEDPPGTWNGCVGTPLDYGFILETSQALDRKFLSKTLIEEQGVIGQILGEPILS